MVEIRNVGKGTGNDVSFKQKIRGKGAMSIVEFGG